MDKTGVILTLLPFALLIVQSITAKLQSPGFRDWYIGTNQEGIRARLRVLDERTRQSSAEWRFTPAEWALYRETASSSRRIGTALVYASIFVLVVLALLYVGSIAALPVAMTTMINLLLALFSIPAFIGFFYGVSWQIQVLRDLELKRDMHTTDGQQAMEREINKLKARLPDGRARSAGASR